MITRTPILAETGTTDGEWFEAARYSEMSFHVDGVNGETLQIRGSNKVDKPANTVHDIQLGTDITADGIYVIVTPLIWIKVMITVGGAGTVNVYFTGSPKSVVGVQ